MDPDVHNLESWDTNLSRYVARVMMSHRIIIIILTRVLQVIEILYFKQKLSAMPPYELS